MINNNFLKGRQQFIIARQTLESPENRANWQFSEASRNFINSQPHYHIDFNSAFAVSKNTVR